VTRRQPKTEQDTPAAVAMGFFDGVHTGHAAVINEAGAYAKKRGLRLAVFTFSQGLKAGGEGSRITTWDQKRRLLRGLGVQTCYQPPFGQFSALPPRAFVADMLLGEYNAEALFCGGNFAFGAARAGNVESLKELCRHHGLTLRVAPTALYKGLPVSSSRIRAALAGGEIEDVNAMLGRPYAIAAPVAHGRGMGRAMGFPTFNQNFPPRLQTPAWGVYITRAVIDGVPRPSVTDYGARPTADGGSPSCETFVPGYEGNLYGRRIQVEFYKKIAGTKKFESPEALARAVRGWACRAQAYWHV
jgi:riboflavin kinase/FMN adenylyltransferase